ncbi:MAG: ABC transporter permease [Castellaniella sp.]|uniref:ABC transporter permease n=1 Tax=Castellaniella sp. TaxID=1955812 RepID=UPI0011F97BD9|nr:ABC transporter permease [Castellaniella sp.]TAN27422.1 MAG: ABC transporter permease [Castellaniella sp.]
MRAAFRLLVTQLLSACLVLLIVAVMVFSLVHLASGDPIAVLLGDQATAADIAQVRAQYGLDQPLVQQFFLWLGQVLHGNLGNSIFMQQPVVDVLWDRAQPTIMLSVLSVLIATLIGVPCGVLAAVWRGSRTDQVVSAVAMCAASVPSFWMGLILIRLFAVQLGWLPASGYGPPDASIPDRFIHLILPSVVLGVLNSALIIRFTRASMLDTLGEDYVRTARAKGLSEPDVILRHVMKNALIPIVTVIGLTMALMIGGTVVTETVFNLPGVGSLVVRAVLRRDYPVIQGTLLVVAFIYVVINFVIDFLYTVIDPRIRVTA